MSIPDKGDSRLELGKLSIAILEHLVEPVIGNNAIQEIKKPVIERELRGSLEKVLAHAEERFRKQCEDKELVKGLLDLPVSDSPTFQQALRAFYEQPTDTSILDILADRLAAYFRNLPQERTRSAATVFVTILRQELVNVDEGIRSKLSTLAAIHTAEETTLIRKTLDRLTGDVTAPPRRRVVPSMRLVIDRVKPFYESQHGQQVVYGTVDMSDGNTAYGEGFTLQLTLENLSDVDVVVPTVDIVVQDHDAYPIEQYDYPVFRTSGTHLEVPGSTLAEPIELTALSLPGSSIPAVKGRIFLRSGRDVDSDHTIEFTLVARVSGVWRVHVEAKFTDSERSYDLQQAMSDTLCIVKR